MGHLFPLAVLAIACFELAKCQVQFPCDHILRHFPGLSGFFEHCLCQYGDWSDVVPLAHVQLIPVPRNECASGMKNVTGVRYQYGHSCDDPGCDVCPVKQEVMFECVSECQYVNTGNVIHIENARPVRVPQNQCESQYALPAEQYLEAVGGYECDETHCRPCENTTITHFICEPPLVEKIPMILPISPSGHNIELFDSIMSGFGPISRRSKRSSDECLTRIVCSNSSQRGRREVITEPVQMPSVEHLPLPVDPIPFHYSQHHARYRRRVRSTYCESPDSVRHVLFMMDTSGSIGRENFMSMTNSVSKLVRYFCRKTKVAMMVFNHNHFLEFCFDCFDNDCNGRRAARDKIHNIPYRGGRTHTGSATQCACETILTPDCGFDVCQACFDVVYITDGHSNDPKLKVCQTVGCLHNQPNADVNVYVFAIGDNVNEDELNCIAGSDNRNHQGNAIFRVPDFPSFSEAINDIAVAFSDPLYQSLTSGQFDCFTSAPGDSDDEDIGLGSGDCTLEE